jgi:predicted neuraminidase
VKVAGGQDVDGRLLPCWNPVLYQVENGPLLLFYKVGAHPRTWWGRLLRSEDSGTTWSEPETLPPGILGPVKNKPVLLPGGALLCPTSDETAARDDWLVYFDLTRDWGRTWERIGPLAGPQAIQPALLTYPGRRLQALCRTRLGRIAESWSPDGGKTWSPLALTGLPNPNSGIDAVSLSDGRQLLVYNPTESGRTPLVVSISEDGEHWERLLTLEDGPGEYSYPAVIQALGGEVHITYTWQRRVIQHAVLAL